MNKKLLTLVLTLTLIVGLGTGIEASSIDARMYGMGGENVSMVDKQSALMINPAGLKEGGITGVKINGGLLNDTDMTAKEIQEFIDDVKSLSGTVNISEINSLFNNLENGTITVNNATTLNLMSYALGVEINNNSVVNKDKNSKLGKEYYTGEATNDLLATGYLGKGFNLLEVPILGKLSFGINGKYFYNRQDEVAITEPNDLNNVQADDIITNNKETKTGFGSDIGLLAQIGKLKFVNVKAGATIENAYNNFDKAKRKINVGASAKGDLLFLGLRAGANVTKIEDSDDMMKRVGLETKWGLLRLRAGAFGTKLSEEERTITYGAGLDLPFANIDLAIDENKYKMASATIQF